MNQKNPNKKTVLYIVESFAAGVFSYLVSLTNCLIDDYNVVICHGMRKETPLDYSEYFDTRVQLICIDSFCREINFKNDIKTLLSVNDVINSVKPDVIHLHSSKAGAIGRIACCMRKTPVFYTPHGYSFLMINTNLLKRGLYYAVEKVLSLGNSVTISCSKTEHDYTLKLGKKESFCVENGIDLKELEKYKSYFESGGDGFRTKTVYTCGRITFQKNPELFSKIASQFPDNRFIWIGEGEDSDKLVSPNIVITGWKSKEASIKIAELCDIFLMTSRWEGLSISLLEAMYLKKLCVVSDAAGNGVIVNRTNGFVCFEFDDYIKTLECCIGSRDSQNDLIRNNAQETVKENHDLEKMVFRIKEIYNSFL